MNYLSSLNYIGNAEKVFDRKKTAFAIIAAISFIAYADSFFVPFLLDDFSSIVNNYAIRNPFDIKPMWMFYANRVIVYITFSINYALHNTMYALYHVTNLILHMFNGFLIYLLIKRILSLKYFELKLISRYRSIIALLAALLFSTHPLQVNAVTYIVQRTASLASMFYFLAVLYFLKYRTEDKIKYFVMTFLFTIAAMFTKENTITIPLMLLALELFFFIKDGKTKWWKRFAIMLAIMLTIVIIPGTNLILKGHNKSDPDNSFKASTSMDRMQYFYTQLNVLVVYGKLLILPDRQNFDYSNGFPMSKSINDNHTYISVVLLILIGIAGLIAFKNNRLVSLGILWFFLTISVESSFISIKDVYFEHRLYLPMPGFIMAAVGIAFLSFKHKRHQKYLYKNPLLYFIITACLLTTFYTGLTIRRNYIYADTARLWEDAVSTAPGSDRAHSSLASAYMDKYESNKEKNARYLNMAKDEFKTAIKLNYNNYTAHTNLSRLYLISNEYDSCITEANISLRIYKTKHAYRNLGAALLKISRIQDAETAFLAGYKLDNHFADILKSLGDLYYDLGEYDKCKFYYTEYLANNKYANNKTIQKRLDEIEGINSQVSLNSDLRK